MEQTAYLVLQNGQVFVFSSTTSLVFFLKKSNNIINPPKFTKTSSLEGIIAFS